MPLLQIEGGIRVVNHSHCRPDALDVRYVDATDAIKVRSSTHTSNPWIAFRRAAATIVDVAYWLAGRTGLIAGMPRKDRREEGGQ